jgi:TolA-binding protein
MERYIRLQELLIDSYILDSPVEIEKGALLLDTHSKAVLLQLRLNILGNFDISSIKLQIDCYDEAGEYISDVKSLEDTYRNIQQKGVKSFGDKAPLIIDPRARKVKVAISEVTHLNGTSWFPSNELISPQQKAISSLESELLKQLNRVIVTLSEKEKKQIAYIPQQFNEFWTCTCGRPNRNKTIICCRCGKDVNWVFSNLSLPELQRNLEDYRVKEQLIEEEKAHKAEVERVRKLEEEREKERIKEERVRKAEEERINKLEAKRIRTTKAKKLFKIAFPISIAICLILVLYILVLSPFIKYSKAVNSFKSNDYEEAIAIFEELGEYKDSAQLIKESKYNLARESLNQNNYKDAIALLEEITDYQDSTQLLFDTKYALGKKHLDEKSFEDAISLFEEIPDYKDSHELLIYSKALEQYYLGEFIEAKSLLEKISDYSDSKVYLGKLEVLIALQGTWEEVYEGEFSFLSFYLDSFVFHGWKYYYVQLSEISWELELNESNISNGILSLTLPFPVDNGKLKYDVNTNIFTFYFDDKWIDGDESEKVFKKVSDSVEVENIKKIP